HTVSRHWPARFRLRAAAPPVPWSATPLPLLFAGAFAFRSDPAAHPRARNQGYGDPDSPLVRRGAALAPPPARSRDRAGGKRGTRISESVRARARSGFEPRAPLPMRLRHGAT